MSDETESVAARLDRAQSQDMEVHTVDSDPLLVEVDNEDHGTTHAVVPDLLYCSCRDHQYRNTVCKHLLFLVIQDEVPWLSDSIRQTLADRVLELDDERIDLQRRLDHVESRLSEIRSAFESVSDEGLTVERNEERSGTLTAQAEWENTEMPEEADTFDSVEDSEPMEMAIDGMEKVDGDIEFTSSVGEWEEFTSDEDGVDRMSEELLDGN